MLTYFNIIVWRYWIVLFIEISSRDKPGLRANSNHPSWLPKWIIPIALTLQTGEDVDLSKTTGNIWTKYIYELKHG